jgi:endonuclease/exonuclease/phosphatase family metal-dependent hydrolase
MTDENRSKPARGGTWKKRMAGLLIALVVFAVLAVVAVSLYTAGPRRSDVETVHVGQMEITTAAGAGADPCPLRVMTLNLAHGRKDGPNQLFRSGRALAGHLDEIAAVVADRKPHVLALQEADGPSIWSGNFNHVQRLATGAGIPYCARAENVKGLKLSYGTALLSTFPLENPVAHTFASSPPSFSKGYLVATIKWPNNSPVRIDLVSIHLDFLRKTVRRKQVEEVIRELSGRNNPLVVMGDFNCQWTDEASPVRHLADALGLHAFRPRATDLDTFGNRGWRLDWILISADLEFSTFQVLPDMLSDHAAVIAELTRKGDGSLLLTDGRDLD